ncbi:MAG: hypothetical protein WC693_06425 [Patescibacteria group bacterium]|jgi:hypothetical protein
MANNTQPIKTIKEKNPITMTVLRMLLIMNALAWLVFGTFAFFGGTTNPDQVTLMKLMSFFMFADAGLFVLVFIGTIKKKMWAYTGGIILLVINIVLSVTDEFGTADFIAIFLSLAALILLLTNKPIFNSFKTNK